MAGCLRDIARPIGVGVAVIVALAPAVLLGGAASPACPIVPVPKEYKEAGRTAELVAEGAAIVVGAKATEPERYAAERLRALIKRRFARELPVLDEGRAAAGVRQTILLGQRSTNAWVDRLCGEKELRLGPESPGPDGFIIEVVDDGGRQAVLVGGSNARGVIYGQGAFFDLLRSEEGKVVFPVVSVRDWASIAWRGRPAWSLGSHLEPGTFDAYARFRLNFVDVRDGPAPKAPYGVPAGHPFDESAARKLIAEAHRRAMFVYGTVSCGVSPEKFDAAEKTFERLIALGVDGLWISFDDRGPGKGTEALVRRVLELGKRHGMTGGRIATTPPVGSYLTIPTAFNRRAAVIPGFGDATWFFTRVPCAGDAAATREIGLTRLPSWWHNWPRTGGGVLHTGYFGATLRANGRLPYLEVVPLERGWRTPTYDAVRDAPRHLDAMMIWSGWHDEYRVGVQGIWAWHPEKHRWPRTRQAIYGFVFGPAQATAAEAFDDKHVQLKKLLVLPHRGGTPGVDWPPRLIRASDRNAALETIAQMDRLLGELEQRAPAETALEPARLRTHYLEPMRATVTCARTAVGLDFPEWVIADLGDRMGKIFADGSEEAVARATADALREVKARADVVQKTIAGLAGLDRYAEACARRVAAIHEHTKGTARARKTLAAGFRSYAKRDYSAQLSGLAAPPKGTVLAEAGPSQWLGEGLRWWGPWSIGLVESAEPPVLGIAYTGMMLGDVFHFAEVRAELPVPDHKGRLMLDVFVGGTKQYNAWPSDRVARLWAGDRLLWEHSIAKPRADRGWLSFDVTDLAAGAKRVQVRFRVTDARRRRPSRTVTCLGAARLRGVGDGGEPPSEE